MTLVMEMEDEIIKSLQKVIELKRDQLVKCDERPVRKGSTPEFRKGTMMTGPGFTCWFVRDEEFID